MKKILALLVAVMMMAMAIPAMAEVEVLQDGQAPVVVESSVEGVVLTDVNARNEHAALAAAFAATLSNKMVVTDLFYVEVPENKPVTLTIEAVADAVAAYVDGKAVEAKLTTKGDVSELELPGSCIVVLLTDFSTVAFEKINVMETIKEVAKEIEDAITNFVGSVQGKPAPAVKAETVKIVKIVEEKVVEETADPSYLIITPLTMSALTQDIITYEMLEWAYANIMENGLAVIENEINAMLPEGMTYADNMIVRDLFEASVYGEYVEKLAAEGVFMKFDLAAGLTAGETVVVLYSVDANEWKVLPAENWTIQTNGDITLQMEDLGAIAFLVNLVEEEPAVTSPNN